MSISEDVIIAGVFIGFVATLTGVAIGPDIYRDYSRHCDQQRMDTALRQAVVQNAKVGDYVRVKLNGTDGALKITAIDEAPVQDVVTGATVDEITISGDAYLTTKDEAGVAVYERYGEDRNYGSDSLTVKKSDLDPAKPFPGERRILTPPSP